jgi:ribonuclease J
VGVLFHTGDFKIDFQPVDGEMIDLQRIAEIGKKGVLLLMAESTNIEREGHSMSESRVGASLNTIFSANPTRRIIIATFASNIHRLQQIVDLCEKYDRKIAFSGRSMLNIADVAVKIGVLKMPYDRLIEVEKVGKYDPSRVCIVTTGAQGEPMSALTRMASGDFNKVTIGDTDTIVISASPIPGNERSVYNVVNNLCRMGAKVIYRALSDIHASGHASREELKTIHALIKPKFFIPVHGEYRHLSMHAEMAMEMGQPQHTILVCELGNQVALTRSTLKKCEDIPAGVVLVDGAGWGDMDSSTLRDRQQMSEDGVLVAIIHINARDGKQTSQPEIITRGVAYTSESEVLSAELRRVATEALEGLSLKSRTAQDAAKDAVKKALKGYLMRALGRSPMIIPFVIEG